LRENQNAVAAAFQLTKQFGQRLQLSGVKLEGYGY